MGLIRAGRVGREQSQHQVMAAEMGWEEGPKCKAPEMTRSDVCAFPHEPRWLRISAQAEHSAWLQAGAGTVGTGRGRQQQAG